MPRHGAPRGNGGHRVPHLPCLPLESRELRDLPIRRDFAARHVSLEGDVSETLVALGYDPQTAGGLLVSIAAERAPAIEAEFDSRRLFIRRVGRVEEGAGVLVE